MEMYKGQPVEYALHCVKENVKDITYQKVQDYINRHSNQLSIPSDEVVKTTFNTDNQFINSANLSELEEEIKQCSDDFLTHIGYTSSKPLTILSWLNVFDKNIMEQEHTHYKSIISGTYYVSSDNTKNSGQFYIPDQIPQRELNRAIFNLKTCDINIDPIIGNMIIFESWMRHGVHPNKTDTTRISIAFNIGNDI
jgi:uncharacterized protein (TIGR02466 family)